MSLNESRLKIELESLQNVCETIHADFDRNKPVIVLNGFEFPDGWDPSVAAIRYKLSPSYPQKQPKAYIASKMRYHGQEPLTMSSFGEDGWTRYAIHKMSWDSDRHTLVTMTRMLYQSLQQPFKNNPIMNC